MSHDTCFTAILRQYLESPDQSVKFVVSIASTLSSEI